MFRLKSVELSFVTTTKDHSDSQPKPETQTNFTDLDTLTTDQDDQNEGQQPHTNKLS